MNKMEKVLKGGADNSSSAESNPTEQWLTQADSLKHEGKTVTVFDATTGKELLRGEVTSYTDLLGSGGILKPDPKRGFDNVQGAIKFPQNPEEFTRQMSKYRFRVEN